MKKEYTDTDGNTWIRGKKLGEGNTGVVYECRSERGQSACIKMAKGRNNTTLPEAKLIAALYS